MPEKRAKTSTRQVVKETLTLQRLSLLSWAFAAILFGSVGFASLQFGRESQPGRPSAIYGQILPPGGDVTTTASIPAPPAATRSGSCRRSMGGLRRAPTRSTPPRSRPFSARSWHYAGALAPSPNRMFSYSRRIAALEEELSQGTVSAAEGPTKTNTTRPAPVPGKVTAAKPSREGRTAAIPPAVPPTEGRQGGRDQRQGGAETN